MSTFLRASGRTSSSSSYDEYRYGVLASNSAAQVSTRLKTGCRPCASRLRVISLSLLPASCAMRLSEKPSRFHRTSWGRASPEAISRSARISSSTSRRNQGSMAESWAISVVEIPARYASPTQKRRRGVGVLTSARMRSSSWGLYSVDGSTSRPSGLCRPVVPSSRLRSAFCRAWLKVRPMDITSPTDFIEVVRVRSAWGNFSKLNRGIFTTQ